MRIGFWRAASIQIFSSLVYKTPRDPALVKYKIWFVHGQDESINFNVIRGLLAFIVIQKNLRALLSSQEYSITFADLQPSSFLENAAKSVPMSSPRHKKDRFRAYPRRDNQNMFVRPTKFGTTQIYTIERIEFTHVCAHRKRTRSV